MLSRRVGARAVYLPATTPPITGSAEDDHRFRRTVDSLAAGLGAISVPPEAFSLGSYFGSGCPVGGAWLGRVAELAIDLLRQPQRGSSKVLVTDLDNTLWAGVIAEDGVRGIRYGPEGVGFRHYVYQTLLARLRREGIVLAALSRNDPDIVLPPLRSGQMPLQEDDFVAVSASYHAKSAQIKQLAQHLNLGLESFVFVDDNPVEREEVQSALPEVRVLAFPDRDEGLPALLHQLAALFERRELTAEDRNRTELYRRRLEGIAPVDAAGADLTQFLQGLGMRLTLHDRTLGDRTRAVQLINKTNQFNANGRRWTEPEVAAVLDRGGRLFGATLSDRTGSHGEILACLITHDGIIEALVMSCRVFQRQVEFALFGALGGRGLWPAAVHQTKTDRNEPFRQFIQDSAFGTNVGSVVPFDSADFVRRHRGALELFEVTWD